jgi:hypothetical protein
MACSLVLCHFLLFSGLLKCLRWFTGPDTMYLQLRNFLLSVCIQNKKSPLSIRELFSEYFNYQIIFIQQ